MSLSPAAPLVSELRDVWNQIDQIVTDVRKLTSNLSERQFNWRADAGRWSMAQCWPHLNAAGGWFLPRIDRGIQVAGERELSGAGPYHHGLIEIYLGRFPNPPPKKKLKAPKRRAPPAAEPPEKT